MGIQMDDLSTKTPTTALEREKQAEYELRALRIVERLLENSVRADWLLDAAKFINQSHYQDVVEERAIEKCCGFPLCFKKLVDIPKKKYHISTLRNAVYDITERKKFCSNRCYKASNYFKGQLLTSPLWLRDQEVIPHFKLLGNDEHGSGQVGEEIELRAGKLFLNENLEQSEEKKETMPNEHKEDALHCEQKEEKLCSESKEQLVANNVSTKSSNNRGTKTRETPATENPVLHVESCLKEWFTVDTLEFLWGKKRVSEITSEATKYYKDQFNKLCEKIEKVELEDQYLDQKFTAETAHVNYKKIQGEEMRNESKVRSFYKAKLYVEEPEPNFPDDEEKSERVQINLPLLDSYAQNTLRRRIVLDRLHSVIPDLLHTINLTKQELGNDLRELVTTFALTAQTIIFSPMEWNLLGLALMKILTLRNQKIAQAMSDDIARKRVILMLMGFQLDEGYLDRLLDWLLELQSIQLRQKVTTDLMSQDTYIPPVSEQSSPHI